MTKPAIITFVDPGRKYAVEAVEEFMSFAGSKVDIIANCFDNSCSVEMLSKACFAVVFGGDGTILSAARYLCQAQVPVVGVNVGKLGFLAEFSIEELGRMFDLILAGKVGIENRMILNCNVMTQGKEVFSARAVNDVIISSGEPFKMIDLKMSVKGDSLAELIGDGVVVSTPTGSTAYNLSAGGPILSANLSAMVITALCPHSLSFRPIVINASSVVQINPVKVNKGTTITIDGQVSHKLCVDSVVTVSRDSGSFLVINNPERTQWETLAQKLNWAEKPKYTSQKTEKRQ